MIGTIRYSIYLMLLTFPLFAFSQKQTSNGGLIKHYEKFSSQYTEARAVEVWLPDTYSEKNKYPVLYLHDGQMLFDSTTSWNHQEWQVDEIMTRLIRDEKIEPCIVVGIYNTGEYRNADYIPQKALQYLPSGFREKWVQEEMKGKARADDYLRFIVKELKPFIDTNFSTFKDRKHTFIGGSSKGGLISMYAICEYPKVFGGAACLSTDWIGSIIQEKGTIPKAIIKYLSTHLPSTGKHKIYFDYGSLTRDSLYKPWQQVADSVMRKKGFTEKDWITREFPGEEHSERAWSKRLHIPLEFLLGKTR